LSEHFLDRRPSSELVSLSSHLQQVQASAGTWKPDQLIPGPAWNISIGFGPDAAVPTRWWASIGAGLERFAEPLPSARNL